MITMSEPNEPDGTKPPPNSKAILLCDQVIVDAMTRKTSLIGLFDGFTLPRYPVQLPPFWAFLQLVDGIGQYTLTVEVHDLLDGATIARLSVPINFPERTNQLNVPFFVAGLPLPHPGVYDFVVAADNKGIGRRRLEAVLTGEGNNAPDQPNPPDGDGE
jgi:hypothetical protein